MVNRLFRIRKTDPILIDYLVNFGLMDAFKAGSNWTEQFLGSFALNIYPINGGKDLLFTVQDSKSIQSFYGHFGTLLEWLGVISNRSQVNVHRDDNLWKLEGNTYQFYFWIEPNPFYYL